MKVVAVLIAYNAAETLPDFIAGLDDQTKASLILVDDASKDDTFAIARDLGLTCFRNDSNLGYGGNLKRGFDIALSRGAEALIELHPDGEYLPDAIAPALAKLNAGADLVLGNRFIGQSVLGSGMRLWKFIPIVALNRVSKWWLAVEADDLHQGFRVYSKRALDLVPFETFSNSYLFSFELITALVSKGARIEQVPVKTRYTGDKRGASLKHSLEYTIGAMGLLLKQPFRSSLRSRVTK